MERKRKLTLLHTGRAAQPEVEAPGRKPLLHYHIPKCAGTTLDAILFGMAKAANRPHLRVLGSIYGQKFSGREKSDAIEQVRNLGWAKDWLYVAGHVPYGKFAPGDSAPNEIALIRDPASRLISMFKMGVARGVWSETARIRDLFGAGLLAGDSMVRQLAGEMSGTTKLTESHVGTALDNFRRIRYRGSAESFQSVVCSILADYGISYVAYENFQISDRLHLRNKSQLAREFEPYMQLDRMFFDRANDEVRAAENGFREIDIDAVAPNSRVLLVFSGLYDEGKELPTAYMDVESFRAYLGKISA